MEQTAAPVVQNSSPVKQNAEYMPCGAYSIQRRWCNPARVVQNLAPVMQNATPVVQIAAPVMQNPSIPAIHRASEMAKLARAHWAHGKRNYMVGWLCPNDCFLSFGCVIV